MKTMLPVVLAVAGLVSLAFGTAAWAQAGYQCTHDCTHQCGILSCYPCGGGTCTCDGGGTRKYIVNDPTLYGSCVPGGVSCSSQQYQCKNQAYNVTDCSSGCCVVSTYITFCKC
jgi:hypothetical protein